MNRSLRLSPFPLRASRSPSALLSTSTSLAIGGLPRWYATHSSLGGQGTTSSSGPTRKQITVISDDGRLRWSELSGKEKVARATQQTFNFMLVVIGAVMTVGLVCRDSLCEHLLMECMYRVECLRSSTLTSSLRTARRGCSTRPSNASRTIHDVRHCWVTASRSKHTGSQRGASGLGTGRSRAYLSIRLLGLDRWSDIIEQDDQRKGPIGPRALEDALSCTQAE